MAFEKGKDKTGGIKKGQKQIKTLLKEELGLTDTKQIPALVMDLANGLYGEADDWTKKFLIWKELAKAGLPKTTFNVGQSFEDWLKSQNDGNTEN
jgi:hypothetical protein